MGSGGLTANGGVVDLNGNNLTTAGNNALPSLSGANGTITDSSANSTTGLTVSQSGNTAFGGSIQTGPQGCAIAFAKYGAGSLTLAGNNTTGSGASVHNSGTLNVSGSLATPILASFDGSNVAVGGLLTAGSVSVANNSTLSGAGTINVSTGASVHNSGILNVNGSMTTPNLWGYDASSVTVGGTLTAGVINLTGSANIGGSGAINLTSDNLYYNSTAPSTFAGTIAGNSSAHGLEVDAGQLTLSGTNSYLGATAVVPAVTALLTIGANNALPFGPGMGNLVVNTGGTLDLAGYMVNVNGLHDTSGNGYGTTSGVIQSSAGAGTLVVGNANATTTFNGVMQDGVGGTLALTKTGSGTLYLGGGAPSGSRYSGATTVNGGVLYATAANTLSPHSAHFVGINGTPGTLDVTAGPQTIAALTIGSLGTLNVSTTNLLSVGNTAGFGGTLNVSNYTLGSGTAEVINYASSSGSFGTFTVDGAASGGYQLEYLGTELVLAPPTGNNSVLAVSPTTLGFGRVLSTAIGTKALSVGLASSGLNATGATASVTGGAAGATIDSTASGAGNIKGSNSWAINVGLNATLGLHSDTVTIQNIGDDGAGNSGSAGPGQGNAQSALTVSVTGNVVAQRTFASPAAASLAPTTRAMR